MPRALLPTISLIASHIGNIRDPYLAQAADPRAQVEGAVRRRGPLPRSGHPERGAVQPAHDRPRRRGRAVRRSEEHTSELQSLAYLVCRLLLEKKKTLEQHE